MKVILNSDVLRTGSLLKDSLPQNWVTLFEECKKRGCPIVIPQTVVMEFDRLQSEHKESDVKALNKALGLLDNYKVHHDAVDLPKLISNPDLVGLIKNLGNKVIIEKPTYDDF
jgi:rRNA-processing protein FCF1